MDSSKRSTPAELALRVDADVGPSGTSQFSSGPDPNFGVHCQKNVNVSFDSELLDTGYRSHGKKPDISMLMKREQYHPIFRYS